MQEPPKSEQRTIKTEQQYFMMSYDIMQAQMT